MGESADIEVRPPVPVRTKPHPLIRARNHRRGERRTPNGGTANGEL
jgi:hypothetical protein